MQPVHRGQRTKNYGDTGAAVIRDKKAKLVKRVLKVKSDKKVLKVK